MIDYNIVFLAIGIVISTAGIIGANIWSKRSYQDKQADTKNAMKAQIEAHLRQKFVDDKKLAQELLENNRQMVKDLKEDMRDYVDKGDLDVKKEMAYAVKLLEKDIEFLQQFIFGKNAKSLPAYLTGEIETLAHDAAEGEGMFRDTEQEALDRRRRNSKRSAV